MHIQSERAALPGGPVSQTKIQTEDNSETTAELQLRSLRYRLAVGYSWAASLAPLIWGVCPR